VRSESPSPVGMHFHRGRVQAEGFDLALQNLFLLQFGEYLI
jgi:hypothetical protein